MERGESWACSKTDKRCWVVVCLNEQECPFRIRCSINKKTQRATFSKYIPHICPASTHNDWPIARSARYIASNSRHRLHVQQQPKLPANAIRDNETVDRGTIIPYLQAWRAGDLLRRAIWGDEAQSFQRIPALLNALASDSEGECRAYTKLETEHNSRFDRMLFKRCWILPKATKEGFQHCKPLLFIDAAHCTARHRAVILGASTKDGEGETFVLAWAVVLQENKDN